MISGDVLIAGAGPTGLVMALCLTRLGVKVQIIDRAAGPGANSRALAVQARTLELYRQLDLSDAVAARGAHAQAVSYWLAGERRARVPLGALGEGLTPYPYVLSFPQDEHERLLVERLEALGGRVQWHTELLDLSDRGSHVTAHVRGPRGDESPCEVAYIVGCDGAHSKVREATGIPLHGGTYPKQFYVADVRASGPAINGEAHIALDHADFIVILPMPTAGHVRLVGIASDDQLGPGQTLSFDAVSTKAIASLKVHVEQISWFSTYRVHHRVADHFRAGRAFLAGDAGHIHSPVGGQGMNTGIGDAINLAWKLAAVLRKEAGDGLLDTYEAERIVFARQLVQTTDRVFTLATTTGPLADFVRTRLMPLIIPTVTHLPGATRFLFRAISQTELNYRHGLLAEGRAGSVHGGDRLPWAGPGGADNFGSLATMTWQAHVYGTAREDLLSWCRSHGLPVHVFPWTAGHNKAGLARDATYLLRPDTYVALADPSGSPDALERYFSARGIGLPQPAATTG
jgi:2-polyprenyl-6-methoxyphenol hydroxylase-like FAD-dependent oxidoreductase